MLDFHGLYAPHTKTIFADFYQELPEEYEGDVEKHVSRGKGVGKGFCSLILSGKVKLASEFLKSTFGEEKEFGLHMLNKVSK